MSLTLNIREDFSRNFDLSIVIPFYKKMAEFKRSEKSITKNQ